MAQIFRQLACGVIFDIKVLIICALFDIGYCREFCIFVNNLIQVLGKIDYFYN